VLACRARAAWQRRPRRKRLLCRLHQTAHHRGTTELRPTTTRENEQSVHWSHTSLNPPVRQPASQPVSSAGRLQSLVAHDHTVLHSPAGGFFFKLDFEFPSYNYILAELDCVHVATTCALLLA
jgi:hypothetical protein